MTLLIPLLNRSPNNFLELRYALRTMERNLPADRLILVGGLPSWCKPDIHISHPDAQTKSRKEENIRDKVLAGMPDGEFIFANDDHFILQHYYIFPNYYSKEFGGTGGYLITIKNTDRSLNYDVHCPIIMDADRFTTMCTGDWPEWGYCLKTLYTYGLPGLETADHKIREWQPGLPWFSTYDGCFAGVIMRNMQKLFPEPSKWEK